MLSQCLKSRPRNSSYSITENGSRMPLSPSALAQAHLPPFHYCRAPICFSRIISSPFCCMAMRSLHPPIQSLPMKTRGTCRNEQVRTVKDPVTSVITPPPTVHHGKLHKWLYNLQKSLLRLLRVEIITKKYY